MGSTLDIESNRKAKKYSRKELLLRVLWSVGKVIFRCSPRVCFGFRSWLLRCFGAKVGKGVNVYPSSNIYFPWNLEIGEHSAIGEWTLVYNLGKITIGSSATVSHRVHLCAGTHDYRKAKLPLLKPPIILGNEVWICSDAFIGPGVEIGDGAVIGAASVVVKDVGPWSVASGNPATFVKHREMLE